MRYIFSFFIFFFPFVTLAYGTPSDFRGFAQIIIDIAGLVVPILFGLALVGFLWGVAQTIINADNKDSKTSGKTIMVWGIIALFVMVSVWSILELSRNTLFGV